jgi:hypothetical protein
VINYKRAPRSDAAKAALCASWTPERRRQQSVTLRAFHANKKAGLPPPVKREPAPRIRPKKVKPPVIDEAEEIATMLAVIDARKKEIKK